MWRAEGTVITASDWHLPEELCPYGCVDSQPVFIWDKAFTSWYYWGRRGPEYYSFCLFLQCWECSPETQMLGNCFASQVHCSAFLLFCY